MSAAEHAMETMPLRRLVAAYAVETRCEFMHMLRDAAFALPMLVIPLAAYMLFGVALASDAIGKDPFVADYLFSGFSVMAVSGVALFGVGCTLALERDRGLMQLKRAQPAPTGSWLVAKMLVALAFATLAYAPVLIAAVMVGKLTMNTVQLASMSALLLAGVLPFTALGLLIGALVSGSAAPAYTNLIYLPMLWLSGMFFPLPKILHAQTIIWPSFHLHQAALTVAGIEKFVFIPAQLAIGVLAGVTVLCGSAAVWRLARKG
jgi:ABC-2 type transport system permease protein